MLFIPSWVLYKSGEAFNDIDTTIYSKTEKPYVLGYAYNGKGVNYEYFKFTKTVDLKPEILVLGSSRVLQFRDCMFKGRFYNAGFTVGTIDDYLTFLKLLPDDYQPELLLLGFDQWMFNEEYYNSKQAYSSSMYTLNKSLEVDNGFLNLLKVYEGLYNGKINYKNIKKRSDTIYLGLNAVINKKGFRKDGSFDYGVNHKYFSDFKTVDAFFLREKKWIENDKKYFIHGEEINHVAIRKYEELLVYCNNKNIKLVSFLPPLPNTVNSYMEQSGNYDYISKISSNLVPLSKKYNSEFYDFTSVKNLEDDTQYIDGHHGNEIIYNQILKVISKSNPESKINGFFNSSNN
jgi:hypothetical protein